MQLHLGLWSLWIKILFVPLPQLPSLSGLSCFGNYVVLFLWRLHFFIFTLIAQSLWHIETQKIHPLALGKTYGTVMQQHCKPIFIGSRQLQQITQCNINSKQSARRFQDEVEWRDLLNMGGLKLQNVIMPVKQDYQMHHSETKILKIQTGKIIKTNSIFMYSATALRDIKVLNFPFKVQLRFNLN